MSDPDLIADFDLAIEYAHELAIDATREWQDKLDKIVAMLVVGRNSIQATDDRLQPKVAVSPVTRSRETNIISVPRARMSPAPRPNKPRVSPIALATANQRLGDSILETWVVNGVKFGDARVSDVNKFCDNRDRTTRLMRAVIEDLPSDAIIRKVLTHEGANERFKAARIELDKKPPTIEATQPNGYRHVK